MTPATKILTVLSGSMARPSANTSSRPIWACRCTLSVAQPKARQRLRISDWRILETFRASGRNPGQTADRKATALQMAALG